MCPISRRCSYTPVKPWLRGQEPLYNELVTRRLPWARDIDALGTLAFRVAAFAYVAFGLLDWETTATALARGGREGNALAAHVVEHFGVAALLAFKGLVVALIIAVLVVLPRRLAVWVT